MSAMYALRRPVIRATLVSASPVVVPERLPPFAHSQKIAAAFPSTSVQTTARPAARRAAGRARVSAPVLAVGMATSLTLSMRATESEDGL